jgi:hypothetical protein
VCYYHGRALRTPLPEGPCGCPVLDRPDRALVVRDLEALLAMPSSGDLVAFGDYAADGCASFVGESGSHAGPSEDEMYGFVLAPPAIDLDGLTHPRELYPLFLGYQERRDEGQPVETRPAAVAAGAAGGRQESWWQARFGTTCCGDPADARHGA